MVRSDLSIGRRHAWGRRWLPILALPVVVIAGCDGGDNAPAAAIPTLTAVATQTAKPTQTATPPSTQTPTATLVMGNATDACEKLASCDQCFFDRGGQCLSTEACAQRLSTDVARCINGVSGCSQSALGDCIPFGCDGSESIGQCG